MLILSYYCLATYAPQACHLLKTSLLSQAS
nr:MAG TPA: hypothetical protein [Caudoviricetes sp.]